MAKTISIASKIDGKFMHDPSAFHDIIPNVSNYTVILGDPKSKFHTSITVDLPSDVMTGITANALIYKGIINTGTQTTPVYTPEASLGWVYDVMDDGYVNTTRVEPQDMLICIHDTSAADASNVQTIESNWNYIQGNFDTTQISKTRHIHNVSLNIVTDFQGNNIPTGTISKPSINANAVTGTFSYISAGTCSYINVSTDIASTINGYTVDANDENMVFSKKTLNYDKLSSISFTPTSSTTSAVTTFAPTFNSSFIFTGNKLPKHRHNIAFSKNTDVDEIKMPNNEIWYRTTDNLVMTPYNTAAFGATIVSNKYSKGLGVITFDSAVTQIGADAFKDCGKLKELYAPETVTSIGSNALIRCTGLTIFDIPKNTTSIGAGAFESCTYWGADFSIPDKVASIGSSAFRQCLAITNIYIPASVKSIAEASFQGTRAESIIVDPANTVFDSRNNCNCIIQTSNGYLRQGCKNSTIPSGVTQIGNSAFSGIGQLVSIDIPNTVTKIDRLGMEYCTGLTSLVLPASLNMLEVESLKKCTRLVSLTSLNTTPPTVKANAFTGIPANCSIYVPVNCSSAYKGASGWSDRAAYITELP